MLTSIQVTMNSNTRKKLTLVSSLSESFILGGPTYGWPSLVYVLRDRGYFSDVCLNSTFGEIHQEPNETAKNTDLHSYLTCTEQDARLQLVFIIGSFGLNSGAFLFGFLFDKYGTRLSRIISSFFILLACLLFAFSSPSTSSLTFVALHLLATGGASILITNSRVGNLFGNYRSTIITLHSGVFSSSAIIFLFVQLAYIGDITMTTSFCILAGVAVFFNINTFILLPKYKIPWPLPSNWEKAVAASSWFGFDAEDADKEERQKLIESPSTSNVDNKKTLWTDLEYQSLICCLISPMFTLLLMWFSVIQLTHFFYIGTINYRLQKLSNDNDEIIARYTTIYTGLQSTCIVSSFFGGLVLDRNKMTTTRRGCEQRTPLDDLQDSILALFLINMITAVFNICSMIPVLEVQLLTYILQITGRSYLFGILLSFISMAFPSKHFGSVYGICRLLAAFVSLLQYPLFQMVQQLFNENSFYVDLLLLLLNVGSLVQPLYVSYFVRKKKLIYRSENTVHLSS